MNVVRAPRIGTAAPPLSAKGVLVEKGAIKEGRKPCGGPIEGEDRAEGSERQRQQG